MEQNKKSPTVRDEAAGADESTSKIIISEVTSTDNPINKNGGNDNNPPASPTQSTSNEWPPPTLEEQVNIELNILATKNLSDIALGLELQALQKKYRGVQKKALTAHYQNACDKLAMEQAAKTIKIESATQRELSAEEKAEQAAADAKIKKLEEAACQLSESQDIFSEFENDLRSIGYVSDKILARSLVLSHGARLLSRCSAFTVYGSSSSGKSEAINKASEFLPPEDVLTITSVSEQAFYYLGNLAGKYVKLGEVKPLKPGDDDYRQEAERQLISENRIVRVVVEKADGKTNAASDKITSGPCVLISSTTTEPNAWSSEYANRRSWIKSNDDEKTTEQVIALQSGQAKKPWDVDTAAFEFTKEKWRTYHRGLLRLRVSIPYADLVSPTSKHVTVRRLNSLLLKYIEISTLLHQATRQRFLHSSSGEEFLIATLDDYTVAHELLSENAPRVLEICSKKAMKALQIINERMGDGSLTTGEIQALLKEPPETVRRWLWELTNTGLLDKEDKKKGKQNVYCKGTDISVGQEIGLVHPDKLACSLIPTVEQLPGTQDSTVPITCSDPLAQLLHISTPEANTKMCGNVETPVNISQVPLESALRGTVKLCANPSNEKNIHVSNALGPLSTEAASQLDSTADEDGDVIDTLNGNSADPVNDLVEELF